MRRLVSIILTSILLVTCSGCFWEHDHRGDGDRDHGGDRHDDHRGGDDRR